MSSPCLRALALAAGLLALAGCKREERDYHSPPPPRGPQAGVSPTTFHVGGQPVAPAKDPRAAQYEKNAFRLSEGKRWYDWYNCYGCHAAGGGDIGPPFIDDRWRYGGEIEQIHASIVEGRPNGMPSFRDKIPDDQIWELAAYIRSMAGNADKLAASSRGDEMQTGEPKTQTNPTPPRPMSDAGADEAGR